MPTTPQEWLPVLTKMLDDDRSRCDRLKSYVDGNAPLPQMGKNTRAAWERFQCRARSNPASLIVESVADRVVPIGVEVAGSTESEQALHAQRIWRDNRLDVALPRAVRLGLIYGRGFFVAWDRQVDGQARAAITAESPRAVAVETDPLRPWVVQAALRTWSDAREKAVLCNLWTPGQVARFRADPQSRETSAVADRRWRLVAEEQVAGDVPVYPWQNPSPDGEGYGTGEFEAHTDLIDRYYELTLERLVTTAMQAFVQRALRRPAASGGYGADAMGEDLDDSSADWTAIFEPSPGALWDLPDGVDIWESRTTDVRPLLEAAKADLRDLAAFTRTPLPTLVPDNQSATGAEEAAAGLTFKARERIKIVNAALSAALLKALRIEGDEPDGTLRVLFEDPARVTLAQKYSAAAQARAAGESWKSVQRNILGRTPDQIRQDEQDRAEEQLSAALGAPETTSGGVPAA